MAKGQMRSTREKKKPKKTVTAEKPVVTMKGLTAPPPAPGLVPKHKDKG